MPPDNILEFSLLTCKPKIFTLRFFNESLPTSGLEETFSSKNLTNQQVDDCAVAQDEGSTWIPCTFARRQTDSLAGKGLVKEQAVHHMTGTNVGVRNQVQQQVRTVGPWMKSVLWKRNVPSPTNSGLKTPT